MIKVVHFDYVPFFSGGLRERLEFEFAKHPDVRYIDYGKEFRSASFTWSREHLESMLPDADVLLIHPGLKNQKAVFEYPKRFPDLRVALVTPEGCEYKESADFGISLFSYNHIDQIVKFVLRGKK